MNCYMIMNQLIGQIRLFSLRHNILNNILHTIGRPAAPWRTLNNLKVGVQCYLFIYLLGF